MKNNSDGCFICGETTASRLEQHHIIPSRMDGPDEDYNLVTLCAGCHNAVEQIYDDRFFDRLGAYEESSRISIPSLGKAIQEWADNLSDELNENYDPMHYEFGVDEMKAELGTGEEVGFMLGRYHMLREIEDALRDLYYDDANIDRIL